MKLNCVNIATPNMIVMKDFYSLVLAAPCFERNSRRYEIQLDNAKVVITYSRIKTPVNPDSCGLEIETDDVEREYQRLLRAGIQIPGKPVTLPWKYRYFAVKDPDGNNIDFVQYVGE